MSNKIVNKVAKSQLKTIDLEEFYPQGTRTIIDIKKWLFQELILRESEFREHLKKYNWSQYKNNYVALTCSSDAIIPSWAFMLITIYLAPFAKKIVVGNLNDLESSIFQTIIAEFNIEDFKNKPLIIKGCSKKPIPETAYIQLIEKLKPHVKSIMFGEPCSTVPLFKKKN